MNTPWGAILEVGGNLIDELFTSDDERAEAKLKLSTLHQQGKLKTMEIAMSAIIAEANSKDPWTSRARPSFMYVIYVLILFAIPMGFLTAFRPDTAAQVVEGFSGWLNAIPSDLYTLFGVGYTGYAINRTYDKHSENKHNPDKS